MVLESFNVVLEEQKTEGNPQPNAKSGFEESLVHHLENACKYSSAQTLIRPF